MGQLPRSVSFGGTVPSLRLFISARAMVCLQQPANRTVPGPSEGRVITGEGGSTPGMKKSTRDIRQVLAGWSSCEGRK